MSKQNSTNAASATKRRNARPTVEELLILQLLAGSIPTVLHEHWSEGHTTFGAFFGPFERFRPWPETEPSGQTTPKPPLERGPALADDRIEVDWAISPDEIRNPRSDRQPAQPHVRTRWGIARASEADRLRSACSGVPPTDRAPRTLARSRTARDGFGNAIQR